MSASREKKLRQAPTKKPLSPSAAKKQTEDQKKARMYKITTIVTVVVLIVALFLALFQNVFAAKTPAAVIGGEKVYPYELNYYYYNSYANTVNNLQQTYGDYAAYFLNTSTSLKSQKMMGSDTTWHDNFLNSALNTVQQVHALCDAAEAEGMTLSQENIDAVEADYQSIYDYVVTENNGDIDYYLRYTYGNGMTSDEYKRLASETRLASQYSNAKNDSFSYSSSDISAYYNEHKNDFDVVTFRSYFFSANISSDMSEAEQAAAKTSAHSLAEIMKNSVSGEESFITLARQYAAEDQKEKYEDDTATLTKDATYSSAGTRVGSDGADWLYETGRQSGDVTLIDSSSGTYVVLFSSRGRNDYNTANVRHILIQFQKDEDADEPSTAQDNEAKAKADAILKEWQDGEATEASFAALATEKTEDPGSKENGGLYENVYKGQMVAEFENWCFDSSRKPGDTGIVRTSYGYHVMYYVSSGSPYWEIQVDGSLRSADYNAWLDDLLTDYPVKRRALGLMSVKLPG